MVLPNISQIFSDFGNDGLAVSFREFLGYFVKQFWPGVNTQIDKLPLSRIDYPLLVLPFFFAAMIALVAFWERPTLRRAAAAGFFAGLLFYVYFNAWVYWLIVLGLLFGYCVLFLGRGRKRLRAFGVLFGVLAIVALPFFANYILFSSTPGSKDFIYRQWLSEGREFGLTSLGWAYLTYALLAFLILKLYRRSDPRKAVLLLAMVLAMAVVWNVQLVTGFVPAPDHWKRIISVVMFIILFQVGTDIIRWMRVYRPRAAAVITIGLVLLTTSAVTKKIVNAASLARRPQPWVMTKHAFPSELADSWLWMNKYLEPEARVISPSSMTSQYLAAYTSTRPYVPFGVLSPLSMAEVEERFLKSSHLFGVSEEKLEAELDAEEKIPAGCDGPYCYDWRSNFTKTPFNLYGCYFSRGQFNAVVNRVCQIPPQYRQALLGRYRETLADWADIPADYVYYGPHERQLSSVEFRGDPGFILVYENPLVEIYKINR